MPRIILIVYGILLVLPLVVLGFPALRSIDVGNKQPEWLLVGLTCLYVVVSTLQWRAMRDALSQSREHTRLSLRPWMVFQDVVITTLEALGPTEPGAYKGIITVSARNTGTWPALNIQPTHRCGVLERQLILRRVDDLGPPTAGADLSSPVCGGGQPYVYDVPFTLIPEFSQGLLDTGALRFWLNIRVTYTDPFGNPGSADSTLSWHRQRSRFDDRGSNLT